MSDRDDTVLTVGELQDELEDISDDVVVNLTRSGALGEATDVYYNVEGLVISGR